MSLDTELAQFTGTENWYEHWTKRIKYTDGVKFVAEKYGAYWLIDAIASYQGTSALDTEDLKDFQLWTLIVTGSKAVLECYPDTGEDPVISQQFEFTDFPETISFYVEGDTLLLPSEH